MKEKLKEKLKNFLKFIANPRLILCLGIAWMITNGWSYVMFGIGTLFKIKWMLAVSGAYLAFLWLPISPEKLVTVAIAIVLLRFMFPKDEHTLGKLKRMHIKLLSKARIRKRKKEAEKAVKNSNQNK